MNVNDNTLRNKKISVLLSLRQSSNQRMTALRLKLSQRSCSMNTLKIYQHTYMYMYIYINGGSKVHVCMNVNDKFNNLV